MTDSSVENNSVENRSQKNSSVENNPAENCPIKVSVVSEYLSSASSPETNRFVFAYHVEISNQGDTESKLISRHWIITDAENKEQVVRGEGVIGKQPVIQPGEVYQYSSNAILETPIGFMQGSYSMLAHDGKRFEAPIPAFTLANPSQLN